AVETTLAEIWSDLLGVDEVGRRDSFFDLGGHSLLVTKLAARLRQAFGVEIPLLDLFNSPTLEQLGRVVEAAEPGASTLPPMVHADRSKPIPLSFPQERVWFLNRLLPGNLAYNFVFAVRLLGPLQAPVLHRVLTEILRRHEIFRTTFPALGDKPVQVIHPPMPAELPAIDLSRLPAEARSPEAERLAAAGGRIPFDVEQLPLIRWRLIRHSPDDHELVQIEQHLVHDGWSVAVFLREMQALYAAFVAGEPSPLPEPEWQFADFAAWQQGWLQGETYEAIAGYWRHKLAGAPLVLELPLDHPRPKVNQHRGALHVEELPYAFYQKLRELDRKESVSLYMTMLAAYFALLHRLTHQKDVLVGSGVANRRLKESEDVIGMIVNTIILRGEVGGDPTFRELMHRVRRTTLEAHSHQDMPFDRLVGELHPQRDLSRNPIFQTMFSFHDSQVPYIRFADLEGRLEGAHNRSAKLDLGVIVLPHAEQHVGLDGPGDPSAESVVMYWEYNTDLFDESTIERWAKAYRRVLEAVAENPDLVISQLPLLSPEGRHELLVCWTDTAAPYPAEAIHRLFEERVAHHPESTALDLGHERLTYGELEAAANRLAHRLLGLGVGAETPVGLCLERSAELIVAELAVLKAGGFFVPLDPAYGEARLAFMLADAAAPVVVTRGGLLPAGAAEDSTVLDLDADRETLERQPATPPAGDVSPERLAYVMYTSGSTGVPKGVAVPHRAVVRLVRGNRFSSFRPGNAFLGFAPASFDASTLEIWAPLLNGGRLVIPPPGPLALEDLADLVAAAGVDHLWLT
ncbi:MAG: AMP-binding protein, partial [Acidobacteria bacterium]|nr:AMP-binding protein [Acidobacteriota bacterium]